MNFDDAIMRLYQIGKHAGLHLCRPFENERLRLFLLPSSVDYSETSFSIDEESFCLVPNGCFVHLK